MFRMLQTAMSSQDVSFVKSVAGVDLGPLEKIECILESYKMKIKLMEKERMKDVINNLRIDEERLKICIDKIELLHRNMFVLHHTKSESCNTDNELPVKDTEYSVTQPELSENEPVHMMNDPKFPEIEVDYLIQPMDCSTNKPDLCESELDFLMQEPHCSNQEPNCPISEPDYSIYEPHCSANVPILREYEPDITIQPLDCSIHNPDCLMQRPDCTMQGPDCAMQEPDCAMNEKNIFPKSLIVRIPKSILSNYKFNNDSIYSKSESSNDSDELRDEGIIYEQIEVEKEFPKQTVAALLTFKEKEMTKSLLKLISRFSSFQRKLQDAAENLCVSTKHFPSKAHRELKDRLADLSKSVLELDEAIDKINEEYSKMLDALDLIYEYILKC